MERSDSSYRITLIPGDGVGPEIIKATQSVLEATGVKFLRMENGAAVYAVGSGTYQFQSPLTNTAK